MVDGLLTSWWIGGLVLILSLAALWFHFFNGIRHLAWDAGAGFEARPGRTSSGIAVLAAAAVMTVITFDRGAILRRGRMKATAPTASGSRASAPPARAPATGGIQRLTSMALMPLTPCLRLRGSHCNLGADLGGGARQLRPAAQRLVVILFLAGRLPAPAAGPAGGDRGLRPRKALGRPLLANTLLPLGSRSPPSSPSPRSPSPERGPMAAYEFIDHTYDMVVVGAGGAGLRATFGWPRRA